MSVKDYIPAVKRKGIVPQLELGPRLGAARTIFEKAGMYERLFTVIVLSNVVYYQDGLGTYIRMAFPELWAWYAFLGLIAAPGVALWVYSVELSSVYTFNQTQLAERNRNPTYQLVEDIHKVTNSLTDGWKCDGCGSVTEDCPARCGCGSETFAPLISSERVVTEPHLETEADGGDGDE